MAQSSKLSWVIITSDSSDDQQNATVWDPQTGSQLVSYKSGGSLAPHTVQILGNNLIGADLTKSRLHSWWLNGTPQTNVRLTTPGKISALTCTPDNNYLIGSVGEKIFVWQATTGKLECIANKHFNTVTCLAMSIDGTIFASGGEDCLINVWDLSARKDDFTPVQSLSHHTLPVKDIYMGKVGKEALIYSASLDRTVRIYQAYYGDLLLTLVFDQPLVSVCANFLESHLFIGSITGSIFKFNMRDPPHDLEYHVLSSNNKEDNRVEVFENHKSSVTCLSVCIDCNILVSGSTDGKVNIWDICSRQVIRTIDHKGPVTSVFCANYTQKFSLTKYKPNSCLQNLQHTVNSNPIECFTEADCESEIAYLLDFNFSVSPDVDSQNNEVEELRKELDETRKKLEREKNIYEELHELCVKYNVPKVNEMLDDLKTYYEELCDLGNILFVCPTETFSTQALFWLLKTTQIIQSVWDNSRDLKVACEIMGNIISRSTEILDVHKQISLHHIKPLIKTLDNLPVYINCGEIYYLLSVICYHYPQICDQHQVSIRKIIFQQIDSTNENLVLASAKCFKILSCVTNHFFKCPDKLNYGRWSYNVLIICNTLHSIMNELFTNTTEFKDNEEIHKIELPQISKDNLMDFYDKQTNRFNNVCVYLSTFLSGYRGTCNLSDVIGVLSRCISITPINFKAENLYKQNKICSLLPSMHISLFKVLSTLIVQYAADLKPHNFNLLKLIHQSLRWTAYTKSDSDSFENIRIEVYKCLSVYSTNIKSLQLRKIVIDEIISFILKDIIPKKDKVFLTVPKAPNLARKAMKKFRDSQYEKSTNETMSTNKKNLHVEADICREALIALQNILRHNQLTQKLYTKIQNIVISLLYDCYEFSSQETFYTMRADCRLQLIKTLKALQTKPHHLIPAPTQYSLQIFGLALRDSDSRITDEANTMFSVLSNIILPPAPSLTLAVVEKSQDRNESNLLCFNRIIEENHELSSNNESTSEIDEYPINNVKRRKMDNHLTENGVQGGENSLQNEQNILEKSSDESLLSTEIVTQNNINENNMQEIPASKMNNKTVQSSNLSWVIITSDSSDDQQNATVWDPQTGSQLVSYKNGGSLAPHTVQILGNNLIGADLTKSQLHCWWLNGTPQTNVRLTSPGKISALTCTPDNTYVIGSIGEKIFVWQATTGKLECIANKHFNTITCLAMSIDGTILASGGEDCLINVWDLDAIEDDFTPVQSLSHHTLPVKDIYMSKIGKEALIYSASLDRTVRIYQAYYGELLLTLVFDQPMVSVCANFLESHLFIGSITGSIFKFNMHDRPRGLEHHVLGSGNGEDNRVEVFENHKSSVTCLSVCIDSRILVSGSTDGKVNIWNVCSGQVIRTIEHKGPVTSAFCANYSQKFTLTKYKEDSCLQNLQHTVNSNPIESYVEPYLSESETAHLLDFSSYVSPEVECHNSEVEELKRELDETKKKLDRLENIIREQRICYINHVINAQDS